MIYKSISCLSRLFPAPISFGLATYAGTTRADFSLIRTELGIQHIGGQGCRNFSICPVRLLRYADNDRSKLLGIF